MLPVCVAERVLVCVCVDERVPVGEGATVAEAVTEGEMDTEGVLVAVALREAVWLFVPVLVPLLLGDTEGVDAEEGVLEGLPDVEPVMV